MVAAWLPQNNSISPFDLAKVALNCFTSSGRRRSETRGCVLQILGWKSHEHNFSELFADHTSVMVPFSLQLGNVVYFKVPAPNDPIGNVTFLRAWMYKADMYTMIYGSFTSNQMSWHEWIPRTSSLAPNQIGPHEIVDSYIFTWRCIYTPRYGHWRWVAPPWSRHHETTHTKDSVVWLVSGSADFRKQSNLHRHKSPSNMYNILITKMFASITHFVANPVGFSHVLPVEGDDLKWGKVWIQHIPNSRLWTLVVQ